MSCPFSLVKQMSQDGKGQRQASMGSAKSSPKHHKSPVRKISSNLSTDGLIGRKISGISVASSSTSEDENCERKLGIASLAEAVGTMIMPSMTFANRALIELVNSYDPVYWTKLKNNVAFNIEKFEGAAFDQEKRFTPVDSALMQTLAKSAADLLAIPIESFMVQYGKHFFKLCIDSYDRELRSLGSTLFSFLSNLDGLVGHIKRTNKCLKCDSYQLPSFCCTERVNGLLFQYFTSKIGMGPFIKGIIQQVANDMYDITVNIIDRSEEYKHMGCYAYLIVQTSDSNPVNCLFSGRGRLPKNVNSRIGVVTFCKTFPFNIMFDQNLRILQLGSALMKIVASEINTKGLQFQTYFLVTKPLVKLTFNSFLSKSNSDFTVQVKQSSSRKDGSLSQNMELTGQMVHASESNAMLFLGSPSVEKLDELIGKGIYLSDIPIHDATRDLILVGEQTKAQDGLKKRMESLKKDIEIATAAVETEKQKNVELLNMVFPRDIAKKLWRGEQVEPKCIENCTMLFSDLVGFTAICSTCTPMEVINMLNTMYTEFDQFCGELDVYKIETIGDAYCVAGGIHRKSDTHAQQIAWMALMMMDAVKNMKAKDGNSLQMRIGLHTGSIVASVVGIKMPRYCLFGNNVTLANKFESGSIAMRINISPTTYELLNQTPGFDYTSRSRDELPSGFPNDVKGTCHFLNSYRYARIKDGNTQSIRTHILKTVEDLDIKRLDD
ncbi:unnamed protein product [Owenia fusiformis]|uniref:guanylate cyclase n=1 Tax=Owenia fusiformis TaxID=6347 RepID=A0A8J1THS2_OWEFU|nr:unnamed protein product [Owenia fusiformis]